MALLEIGVSAPEIEVGEWVSGQPSGTTEMSGKSVVLEFWGTHCGPCISAIPHLNELFDKYASEKVLFISISQDAPDLAARFLQKRPIKGAVGIDRDTRTFNAYGIRGIPHTVLIDGHGILRWQGHPNHFTEALLRTFLESDQVPAVQVPPTTPEVVPAVTSSPLFSFSISPNTSGPGGHGFGDDGKVWRMELIGCSIGDALRILLDRSTMRTRIKGTLPEGRWDIEMRATLPLKPTVAREKGAEALCSIFGIKLSRMREQREGWKLVCPYPRLTDMAELGGGMSVRSSPAELSVANVALDYLAKLLEPLLGTLLLNGTNLPGKYDFKIPVTSLEVARSTLETDYGIILEPAVCELEMVELEISEAAFS
jgi:thiol-disulfide isomerase/thioredoxin